MVRIAAATDPGARGGANQDSIGWDESRQFALVADGMGGVNGGEIASGLVKQTLLQLAGTQDLAATILQAHAEILRAAAEKPELAGMGSTVVAAQIGNRLCRVAWVGDSRAYLWRRGELRPLTRDHSVAELLRDADNLSETQLRELPQRHQIMQSLGRDQPVPSCKETPLRRADWLLLCSDGLSGELRDHEIAAVLSRHRILNEAPNALIAAALAKGGSDNVSVVLVEYAGPSSLQLLRPSDERLVVWLSVLGGIALAMAVGVIAWWLRDRR
jgi:PPM family protein phosphatase